MPGKITIKYTVIQSIDIIFKSVVLYTRPMTFERSRDDTKCQQFINLAFLKSQYNLFRALS